MDLFGAGLQIRQAWIALVLACAAFAMGGAGMAAQCDGMATGVDIAAKFAAAVAEGRVGLARKTRPIDARPARIAEVIVTVIAGEGKETQSRPAEAGDRVVRNRCPATGNEEYLVSAAKFPALYGEPRSDPDAEGWQEFHPAGAPVRYFIVPPGDGAFTFRAPWGEDMVARPGDAIAQSSEDERDIYRIAAASFACSYEIIEAPGPGAP